MVTGIPIEIQNALLFQSPQYIHGYEDGLNAGKEYFLRELKKLQEKIKIQEPMENSTSTVSTFK